MLLTTLRHTIGSFFSPAQALALPANATVLRIALICLLALAAQARADTTIHIVAADTTRYYQQVANDIAGQITRDYPAIRVSRHPASDPGAIAVNDDSLLISIGTTASIAVAQQFPHQPQLSLFITADAWDNLAGQLPKSHKATLFIDQPVERLLALARVLVPQAKNYGTVFGPVSAKNRDSMTTSAAAMGTRLASTTITADSNPLTALTPLVKNAEVFIAVPDEGLINRNISKWLLHLAFKHRVPVIGFSRAYSSAGAAASLYTSEEDITRQAMAWLQQYLATPDFDGWHNYPPDTFTISVNPSVIGTLGLERLEPTEMHARVLHQLEGPRP